VFRRTGERRIIMKKILVIEDESPVRAGIAGALRRNAFSVLETGIGSDGLNMAFEHQPDLILSDVNLPGMNGFDVLKALRARPETSAIPVILMTGETHKADARISMERGADDYLPKPFTMEQMLSTINARLERQDGIRRALEAQTHAERTSIADRLRLKNAALEAAANGICITDRDGKIAWVNRAFSKLTGYNADEVVGQNPRFLKSGRQTAKFYSDMWNTISRGEVWHGELVNKCKDGSFYDGELTITPVCDENGAVQDFVAIQQDITERKQMEQALAHERDLLLGLMDNLPDYIYFKDDHSRFTRINKALAQHFSLKSPEEALGRSDADFFPLHEARQKLTDEQRMMAADKPILGLIEKSDAGGQERWVSSTKVPIHDAEGNIIGLVGISRDVTTAKRAEEERQLMEVQLRQSQKLESIGQLAAGIAHEINTPTQYVGDNTRFIRDSFGAILKVLQSHEALLTAVKNNSVTSELVARTEETLARSDLNYLREQIPQALGETLEGVERVAKIVRAMKEFSHPGGKEKTPADLNKAIESTITVARNEWKYVADLKLDPDPALPLVPCFLGEFNQAILNLVVNAAHAIGDAVKNNPGTKGLITVTTRRDSGHVEVRVADTGTGIPETVRSKIFEPFFTTKGVGRGTGQGLAMIYACIVKRHGGTVTFETETGKGTTFILRLPLNPSKTVA